MDEMPSCPHEVYTIMKSIDKAISSVEQRRSFGQEEYYMRSGRSGIHELLKN